MAKIITVKPNLRLVKMSHNVSKEYGWEGVQSDF